MEAVPSKAAVRGGQSAVSEKEAFALDLQDLIAQRPANRSSIVLPFSSPILTCFSSDLDVTPMEGTDNVRVTVRSAKKVIKAALTSDFREIRHLTSSVSTIAWYTLDEYQNELAKERALEQR